MKRTATTLVLLAGLGGGCTTANQQAARAPQQQQAGGFGTVTRGKQIDNLQGPMGEPVMATARGAAPSGVRPAGGNTLAGSVGVRPAGGTNHAVMADGSTGAMVPGVGGNVIRQTNYVSGVKEALGGLGQPVGGPPQMPHHGIVPVPTMGPPGAVAYVGPFAGAAARGGQFTGRSSINFTAPGGMNVMWQLPDGTFNSDSNRLTAPQAYNFLQGQVYRLKLGGILPDYPGVWFYPTLEVAPANPKSLTFLSHSSVPVTFAADDFAQAAAGNLVVKVIYLPDPINQDFRTVIGAEEVVSTRLDPGADPVAEAQRRGTILAIIRMGNINLENGFSPAMTAPPPGAVPPPGLVPVPPGFGGPPPGIVPLVPGGPAQPAPKSEGTPSKKIEISPPKTGTEPAPKAETTAPALPLAPVAPLPLAPTNPPGTASVKTPAPTPAALPALPLAPSAPANLPSAPVAPTAPPPKVK